MAKVKEQFVPFFTKINWTDSKNNNWVLEESSIQSIEEQKAVKEAIPLQVTVNNERTQKQLEGIYAKLEATKTAEDAIKIVFRMQGIMASEKFLTQTFIHLLKQKEVLATDPNDKKCMELAISALIKMGAVPKKLKIAWTTAKGISLETDE